MMNKLVLSAASASAVQQGLTQVEEPGLLNLEQTIGNGLCQVFAGWDFFDLKKFDGLNRDMTKSEPAIVESETSSLFYKICQPDWVL